VTDDFVPLNRDGEPSSSLLLRVQAQEQAAWERLVHLYTPLVYGWCRRASLQEADALDVGQNVFETVWRKIGMFHRSQPGDTFRGWLRTIARHKIIDLLRRGSGDREVVGGSAAETLDQRQAGPLPEPDAAQDSSEAGLLCRRAMALIQAEFEEKTWLAFQAVVLNDQKPAEAAAALDMSVNAVYLAKSRVLRRLRQEFEDLIDL
jgi:RNA polymerase sigma-70 factor (ECF subfamily)